jgi:hypothetical protein
MAVTMKNVVFWNVTPHVAPVIPDVSEELRVSFMRATRIGKLGTTLAVTSNRRTKRRICISSQRASVASYSERSS